MAGGRLALIEALGLRLRKGLRRKNKFHARHGSRIRRSEFTRLTHLEIQPLEERLMLAGDELVVGRALSTWTASGVVGNALTITYSVYNQQAEELRGVSLFTTLQPGVSFANSSQAPIRNGQQLTWTIGALPGFSRASIDVTVSLANPNGAPIDNGVQALATLAGGVVGDNAPPVALRTGNIAPALLASTIDATATDPFIQEQAAKLDYDASRIFAYLRDDVGYESYVGSLRGARGTLWSSAGNSLDEASLGVALLRASGIPARYARGTLSDALTQQLILSMFPEPLRITGFIPTGAATSNPASDSQLRAETRDHFWVQFDAGTGFQNADSSFSGAAIGQTFTAVTATLNEVPDGLRHKVHIELDRELANTASALFNGGATLSRETVLDVTFNSVELVGRPLSIGHFVQSNTLPSPVFSAVTHVYSPYIAVGDYAQPLSEDHLVRGTDYQEFITSFPFGSEVLTGVFLNVQLSGPDGPAQSYERALLDKIGFDVRQNGGSPNLGGDPTQPSISPLDISTLNLAPSRLSPHVVSQLVAQVAELQEQLDALTNTDGTLPPDALPLLQKLNIGLTRLNAANYILASDVFIDSFADSSLVKAYFDRPRIIIASAQSVLDETSGEPMQRLSIDLRRDAIRAIAFPGQSQIATAGFQLARGLENSILESAVLQIVAGEGVTSPDAATVFLEASDQNIPVTLISQENLGQLDGLDISLEAKARITAAVAAGRTVLTPTRSVTIDGKPNIAWYEIDPVTGDSIGVTEDGGHQGIAEYAAVVTVSVFLFGVFYGRIDLSLVDLSPGCYASAAAYKACLRDHIGDLDHTFFDNFEKANVFVKIVSFITLPVILVMVTGVFIGRETFLIDPPLQDMWISPAPRPELAALTGPGELAIGTVVDPQFTLPVGGSLLPTVFRVGIKNQTNQTQRYRLTVSNVPAGFTAVTSVPQIDVPAGETAEVGLALRPTGALPDPGTSAPFNVTVQNVANTTVTRTQTVPFTVPAVRGVTIAATPDAASAIPGSSTTVDLAIASTANVVENVSFEVVASSGLTVTGLNNLILNPRQQSVATLTVTVAAGVPLNSTLSATITANFGGAEPVRVAIPLLVAAPGAKALADAATAAASLGDVDLSRRLGDLSVALTNLAQDVNNPVYKGQALASLDSITSQMAADKILVNFVTPLTTARSQLAAATTGVQITAAINQLGATLDDFAKIVTALGRGNFELFMVANSQLAQPLVPRDFVIQVHNIGTDTTTYNLAVSGLPAGVTATFSQPSTTLARGASANVTLTLTQTTTDELLAFNFSVDVSIAGVTPKVTKSVVGSLETRDEFVSIVGVSATPPFANPGQSVSISARVLNAVNRAQSAQTFFEIRNAANAVVFTSSPVNVTLGVVTSLATVQLGQFNTTGLPLGNYTIRVVLNDLAGKLIPGGVGEGSLLVGSPVTASIDATPEKLPPGTNTVTSTVSIDNHVPLADALDVVGQAPVAGATSVVRNGDFLYVAGSAGISVFNIAGANLNNPQLVRTVSAAAALLKKRGNLLVAVQTTGTNSSLTKLDTFSLTDPANPQFLGTTGQLPYGSAADVVLTDTHAFVVIVNFWFTANHDVFAQTGGMLAINISNPAAPVLDGDAVTLRGTPAGRDGVNDGVLFNINGTSNDGIPDAGADQSGGDHMTWSVVQAAPTILLVTASSATGTNTQAGVGQVHVVDISDPRNMQDLRDVQIPGTVHAFGVAVDGNRAVITATQGGIQDLSQTFPFTGNMILATLDLSDPAHPQVVHTQDSGRPAPGVGFDVALGNGLFALPTISATGNKPGLFVLDANDPNNLVFAGVDVPAAIAGMSASDNFIYTTDHSSLIIYQVLASPGIPVTAEVKVPNNSGVEIVPNSFNISPTTIIDGPDFDTLVFDFAFTAGQSTKTFTWQSRVTGLQPGESRAVTLDGTVDFFSQGMEGQVSLPPQDVFAEQILALAPASQVVQPGAAASYTITIANPTTVPVTYDLSVGGVASAWVTLAPRATVAPGATLNVPLTLKSDAFAAVADYGFVVTATTGGVVGSVNGVLRLVGAPVLPTADADAHGLVMTLNPTEATAGIGTTAVFTVRLTNTGSETDAFQLGVQLPAGFDSHFDQTVVLVPPGASNFREVTLTVTPRTATLPSTPFQVIAASAANSAAFAFATGVINVVGLGVEVELTPGAGTPGTNYALKVTNRGNVSDTYDLSVAAPAALVAALATQQVTLGPGQSQMVAIQVGGINFAFPGALELMGVARSHSNSAIFDAATADVNIAATSGLNIFFDPDQVVLHEHGSTELMLIVENTGNVEMEYSATILGVTGGVHASFRDENGQPTPTIPQFIVPGLSKALLIVDADLLEFDVGTVIVGVFGLGSEQIAASTIATISIAPPATGSISGLSYVDVNNNGLFAPPEHLILGTQILLKQNGELVASTFTNLAGEFRFDDLPAGTYVVEKIQPAIYFDGKDTAGSLGDADAAANQFTIVLGEGGVATGYLFAERGLLPQYIGKTFFLASTPANVWQNLDLHNAPMWTAFNTDEANVEISLAYDATAGAASVAVYDSAMHPVEAQMMPETGAAMFHLATAGMHYLRVSGDNGDVDLALAFSSLPGDFDHDNDVDGADFLAWQRGVGTNLGAVFAQGDDADADAARADLALWGDRFGSVEEPADLSAALLDGSWADDSLEILASGATPSAAGLWSTIPMPLASAIGDAAAESPQQRKLDNDNSVQNSTAFLIAARAVNGAEEHSCIPPLKRGVERMARAASNSRGDQLQGIDRRLDARVIDAAFESHVSSPRRK